MMSNQVFSSTEELYDEASADEALNSYHPESQMRYYENVVYVPHVFSPVMLVEYVPVFYNYLTYEPYLMNRFEVVYVPFLRQASITYLVPYYLQTQQFFSSSTLNEYDTPSNSYLESSLGDESSSDDLSSSISYSDETSVLSLSSSYSYNSVEVSDIIPTQEPCESLEGVACNENDDSYDRNCVEEHSIIAREYTEGFVGADVSSEANASNLSFLLLDDENSPAVLDCSGNYLDQILRQEDRRVVSDVSSIPLLVGVEKQEDLRGSKTDEASSLKDIEKAEHESPFSSEGFENHVVFDDSIISKPHVTNLSLLVDDEKPEDLRGSETDEACSLKDIEKAKHESHFSSERFENDVVFDDSSASKPHVSNLPLLVDYEKPEDLIGSKIDEACSLKDIEKAKHESYFSSERFENDVVFGDSSASKPPISNLPLLVDYEKPEDLIGSKTDEACSLKYIEKAKHESHFSSERFENDVVFDDTSASNLHVSNLPLLVDYEKPEDLIGSKTDEACSLKDIEKAKHESHFSSERFENDVVFDDTSTSKPHVSNLPLHDDIKKSDDENKLLQDELSPFKNENVKRYDSHTSSQMPAWSQGISLQKTDFLDKIDVKVPDPFDYDISENESDSDDDSAITLQDILASDENWGAKRQEYLDKRRNTHLYRSALEGNIRPRRSLPEVGTLATIFEDLPYPINDPYDDGVQQDQESVNEQYFELPPLEVERSKSSRTTLLPKKKRFHNTKKFFSGLFRCLKPR